MTLTALNYLNFFSFILTIGVNLTTGVNHLNHYQILVIHILLALHLLLTLLNIWDCYCWSNVLVKFTVYLKNTNFWFTWVVFVMFLLLLFTIA